MSSESPHPGLQMVPFAVSPCSGRDKLALQGLLSWHHGSALLTVSPSKCPTSQHYHFRNQDFTIQIWGGGDTFRPEQRGRGWIRRVFHPCIGALSVLSKLSKTSCQLGESFWVNFSLPKHCHFITHSQSSQLFPNVVMILIVVTIINTPVFPFYYHCHYTATFAQYFLTTSDSTTQKQWKRSTPNSLAMRDAEMAKHSLQDHTPVKLLGSPEACLRAPSTKLTLRLPFPGHWIPSLD